MANEDCPDCHGMGWFVCLWCHGSGRTEKNEICEQCQGKGTLECLDH